MAKEHSLPVVPFREMLDPVDILEARQQALHNAVALLTAVSGTYLGLHENPMSLVLQTAERFEEWLAR